MQGRRTATLAWRSPRLQVGWYRRNVVPPDDLYAKLGVMAYPRGFSTGTRRTMVVI